MSSSVASRISAPMILRRKGEEKIVALTAYTAPVARAADAVADILLVGDSLGMVLYGLPSTLQVTLGDMMRHGAAVVRSCTRALVVVDMPFGSYQASPRRAFANAARLMRTTGCGAVKLEGGAEMAETVRFLTQRGIPVMAHIGLRPQHVHTLGGYRYQGRTAEEETALLRDAEAVAQAGAFTVVLECVEAEAAARITTAISVPTIGIGSGAACDGQVLVTEDMLGLTAAVPRFVKRYAELDASTEDAVAEYAAEVRSGAFPAPEQSFFRKPPRE